MAQTVSMAADNPKMPCESRAMIQSQDELTIVREQLSRIEDAIASMRRDVMPFNAGNFEILAEGYVRQIKVLRAEIENFLGLVPVHAESTNIGMVDYAR